MFVEQLWRYPVKSMGGERVEAIGVAPPTGLDGDRMFALIDGETGTVVSGKYPRRWGALLQYRARLDDGRLVVDVPGRTVSERELGGYVSEQLGRRVLVSATPSARPGYQELQANGTVTIEQLAAGAPNTFFDYAPVHLITTGSLRRLARVLPKSSIAIERFRPNLVIDTGDADDFVENAWEGRRIVIGDTVVLEIAYTCPRCVMVSLAQPGLDDDPVLLKGIATHNTRVYAPSGKEYPTLGMYATVVTGGAIKAGDPVRLS